MKKLKSSPSSKKSYIDSLRLAVYEKHNIWNLTDLLPFKAKEFYYRYVKTIFQPCHKEIRKSIPREWRDISDVMVIMNFEAIKSFYREEYLADIVDWQATESTNKFSLWLTDAYQYITLERPQLLKDLEHAYPDCGTLDTLFVPTINEDGLRLFTMQEDPVPYEIKYKEVTRLQALIEKKDTDILLEFVRSRDLFWT